MSPWIIAAIVVLVLSGGLVANIMHDNRWGECWELSYFPVALLATSWLAVILIKVMDHYWLKTHKSVDRTLYDYNFPDYPLD